jgi:predicted dehydrogenase
VRTGLSVGIVGLGEWGRATARCFAELPHAEIRWLCDRDPKVTLRSHDRYPEARRTTDLDDLLDDEALDAIVVATPAPFRCEIARQALDADKHVLVCEPFALAGPDADDLVARAERRARRLVPCGSLVQHPAVRALANLLERGELGETYYVTLVRQAPGGEGSDVLWDLGATDVSLVLALLRDTPVEAVAAGECYVAPGVRDLVACHLHFATGISAQLHLSRLGHRETHELVAVGSRRTAVFDGTGEGRLSVYEGPADSLHLLRHDPELGAVVTPRFAPASPLRLDCEAFLAAIRGPDDSLADARRAAATVNVLQTLDAGKAAEEPLESETPTAQVLHLPAPEVVIRAASADDGRPA